MAMGSFQIGEITRICAFLYNEGIDILELLQKFADEREIRCNRPLTKTEKEMFAHLHHLFGHKAAVERFDLSLRLARAGLKELDREEASGDS